MLGVLMAGASAGAGRAWRSRRRDQERARDAAAAGRAARREPGLDERADAGQPRSSAAGGDYRRSGGRAAVPSGSPGPGSESARARRASLLSLPGFDAVAGGQVIIAAAVLLGARRLALLAVAAAAVFWPPAANYGSPPAAVGAGRRCPPAGGGGPDRGAGRPRDPPAAALARGRGAAAGRRRRRGPDGDVQREQLSSADRSALGPGNWKMLPSPSIRGKWPRPSCSRLPRPHWR